MNKEVAVFVTMTMVLAADVTFCNGCQPGKAAQTAAVVSQAAAYGGELRECYEKAKTYDSYESCAKGVDAKYGRKP